MKNSLIILLLFSASLATFAKGPVNDLPSNFKVGGQTLELNGTGIRTKYFVDLLLGGLYLQETTSQPQKIIEADELMAIRLEVISSLITKKRLKKNMRDEFSRVAEKDIDQYSNRIDKLINTFNEDIKVGDIYDLIYFPGEGLKIYKNQNQQAVIEGLDFKQLVFKTWLGDDPADEDFKEGLLGK